MKLEFRNRVLVCGSRYWKDRDLVFEVLDELHALTQIDQIIEGCAKGADELAGNHPPDLTRKPPFLGGWAWSRKITARHFPAKWDEYGKAAGHMRNNQMLIEGGPFMAVAFHDDLVHSAGTGDMVKKLERANITIIKVKHGEENGDGE